MTTLVVAILLTSCQSTITPTPEIQEVTRIVKQTSLVTQFVEQTVEVSKIVKETVIINKLVPAQTMTSRSPDDEDNCYKVQSYYFDAMIALVQHYTYLKTHQCEDYMNSFTESEKEKRGQQNFEICENGIKDVVILSIYPYNYLRELNDGTRITDVDDLILFVVTIETYFDTDYVHQSFFWVPVVLENGEWKVGPGRTSPN